MGDILCVTAAAFRDRGGSPGYDPRGVDRLRNLLRLGSTPNIECAAWIPREQAESDERYLQVVPYCIAWRGGRILHYRRPPRGGEARLAGLGSIGVGGHVERRLDELSLAPSRHWTAALHAGRRELREEIGARAPCEFLPVATLLDDSNPVGRVHLGLVIRVELSSEPIVASPEVVGPEFLDPEAITPAGLEPWSALCLPWAAAGMPA